MLDDVGLSSCVCLRPRGKDQCLAASHHHGMSHIRVHVLSSAALLHQCSVLPPFFLQLLSLLREDITTRAADSGRGGADRGPPGGSSGGSSSNTAGGPSAGDFGDVTHAQLESEKQVWQQAHKLQCC